MWDCTHSGHACRSRPCQQPTAAPGRSGGATLRGGRVRPGAGTLDVMPAWTLDQIAGLAFAVGGLVGVARMAADKG